MELRVSYTNLGEDGGTFVTPVWFGLHDTDFDLFEVGDAAREGLERIAEDGTFDAIAADLAAADPGATGGVITGPDLPTIGPGVTGSVVVDGIDGTVSPLLSFAAMILPSNDAFIGTSRSITLFNDEGEFRGARTLTRTGNDVLDAGTEVNTELDAAFLNQAALDTGIDQGGVIAPHVGFIGSANNPVSEFDGMILGATNAAGAPIDQEAADFTLDRDARLGQFRVNVIERFEGTGAGERLSGSGADDIASGARGDDTLLGRGGWDELSGGSGDDILRGNFGNDTLNGGAGEDLLIGGSGEDTFVFAPGDADIVRRIEADDHVDLTAYDATFEDVSVADARRGVLIEVDGDLVARAVGLDADAYTEDLFLF